MRRRKRAPSLSARAGSIRRTTIVDPGSEEEQMDTFLTVLLGTFAIGVISIVAALLLVELFPPTE